MTAQIYEHHINIKKNKLCPFLMRKLNNIRNSPCNWHKNIEVLLVTDGEGRLQYNSEDLPLSEGDIIVINSGDIHRLYSASGISYYYIIIDESFCRENGIDTEKRCFEKIFRCKKTEDIYNRLTEAYGRYKEPYIVITPDEGVTELSSIIQCVHVQYRLYGTKNDNVEFTLHVTNPHTREHKSVSFTINKRDTLIVDKHQLSFDECVMRVNTLLTINTLNKSVVDALFINTHGAFVIQFESGECIDIDGAKECRVVEGWNNY